MTHETKAEEWEERFDNYLIKSLDYLGLKQSAFYKFYNRPPNEIIYPEFGKFHELISSLLAEQKKALIQELLDEAPENMEEVTINRLDPIESVRKLNKAMGFNKANTLWKEKLTNKLK